MTDAPNKRAVESATLVVVEMLRSPTAGTAFQRASAVKCAEDIIESHRKLVEYFQQYPEHDAAQAAARYQKLSS